MKFKRQGLTPFWVLLIAAISMNVFGQKSTSKPKPEQEPLPKAAVEYLDALAFVEKAKGHMSIEELYNKAIIASDTLNKWDNATDTSFVSRWFGKDRAPYLEDQMVGLLIWDSPEFEPGAFPDIKFFLQLAVKQGLDEDIAFFKILNEQYPTGCMEIINQSANYFLDHGGGIKYGFLILTKDYSKWLDFQKKYPNSYKKSVAEYMGRIAGEFLGDCLCAYSKREDVIKEFKTFLKLELDPQLKAGVEKCMQGVESGKTKIDVDCCPRIH